MKCYGITVLPSEDWICSMCQAYGKEASKALKCVLCSVSGGALKPTIHQNTGQIYPFYPVFDQTQANSALNPELIWCHVFCAFRVPGVLIANRKTMNGIDVSQVEPERWKRACKVCGSDKGATLLCQHRKCEFSFHPECGKELLVAWKKFGLEEEDCYCLSHRPIKLGKMIENRDRTKLEEIQNFVRLWEKLESKPPLHGTMKLKQAADSPWSFEETEQLEREVMRYLRKINERQKIPFEVAVNLRSISRNGQVTVTAPEVYNHIPPEAILSEKICIRNRSSKDCYQYFQTKLMLRMRFELDLCKTPVKVYIPKKRRRLLNKGKGGNIRDNPVKRPRKHSNAHRHLTTVKFPDIGPVLNCEVCGGALKQLGSSAELLFKGENLCENCGNVASKPLIS